MVTLDRTFYLQPATAVAGAFLGKVLVHETPWGRLSGVIYDVEAYPAFVDGVHHGNKRTKRSEVMAAQWPEGRSPATLSNSPGKVCKSMLITTDQYGAHLCGDVLFIRSARRVGINTSRQGFDAQLRYFVKPAELGIPAAS